MAKTDWPVKTLGEVCELVSRGRPPSYCEVGGVIVLNQKCVRNGQIDFGPSRRTDNSVKAIPEWAYLREGDTLINSTGAGTLGRASFVSFLVEPTTFDTHLTVVRPLTDACWPAFVGLVLNGREKDIVDLAGGATGQTELPREAVRSFEIPVPPLEEQKRIVALLDNATARVTELTVCYEQARTHANNLFASAMRDALESNPDWPVRTLGDLCDIYQPQTISTKDLIADGKYIVYGANGPIGRYDRFNHEKSEVTVTCRGATCGTVNVTPPEVWITGNAMVVRPNDMEMSKEMMRFVLEGLDYSRIITGAAQPQITRQTLAPLTIQVPPLDEQKRIVARLDLMRAKTSEMVAAYDAKLTAAKNLRQSILESAFAGDL